MRAKASPEHAMHKDEKEMLDMTVIITKIAEKHIRVYKKSIS